jgi:hypothetical protein
LLPAFVGFLLGLLFDPEDEGDMFLRNIGLSPYYTALQARRPYSSGGVFDCRFLLSKTSRTVLKRLLKGESFPQFRSEGNVRLTIKLNEKSRYRRAFYSVV